MNKKYLQRILLGIFVIIFWLTCWEILARTLNVGFIFPSVFETVRAFIKILFTSVFYKSLAFSLLRVLIGFTFGLIVGCVLAPLAYRFRIFRALVAPFISVIKSAPVASFIMVLWCFIGATAVPIVIGALMVAPLIYHNLYDALKTKDRDLAEICKIYDVQGYRKFRYLYFPKLLEFLIPSTVSGIGLCWKASVAAEIIAYTKNSVGRQIYYAKAFLDGAELFAYTITVILMSLLFEQLMQLVGKWVKKKWRL